MSAHANPDIIDDGLAFMYDTGSGKSYKGEPTNNLVPTPEANSRFTTSNNWQTYNTNQYNSNTYFSIGTISSISNNIVTLGSVGRNIRSFDVLKPETTGGGVIAGASYVIKKISSTTFSLHEYNNSQNGSQGYINPDTGFFKVHDAYANDTRISINATDFPTSWWGGPHLPNSGLIKEIVEGGGRVSGTNAMRLHVYRDDGVVDGMAYGVYCPVTVGDVITISVWLKRADGRGGGKSIGYSTYFGSGYSGSSTSFGSLNTEWTRYQYTWTASNTFSFYSYWWPNGTTAPYAIDMCDFQVEINGHATPFVVGTRSTTQGLLDLTNNATINLSNVSFDSNAQMVFDGTDDYTSLGNPTALRDLTSGTIETVYYRDASSGTYQMVFTDAGSDLEITYLGNTLQFYIGNSGLSYTHAVTDQWFNVVGTWGSGFKKLYINGVEVASGTNTGTDTGNRDRYVGGRGANFPFNGEIPIAKIYNKALTASEVLQNYNAIKGRFQ